MERTIEYKVNDIMDGRIKVEDYRFWACLRRNGMSDQAIENILLSESNLGAKKFWENFGYKYISIFADELSEKTDADDVKKICVKEFSGKYTNLCYMISEILKLFYRISDATIYTESQQEKRERIAEDIRNGVENFKAVDIKGYEKQYINGVKEYLSNDMTVKEKITLQELPVEHDYKGKKLVYPLTPDGRYAMGIVNPWPGSKSAEAEVLSRMQVGAEDIDLDYVMLDNFGHVLDKETQEATEQYVDSGKLQFVLTTHYDSEKTVDAFAYHTLWNPPEIPLNLGDYDTRITNNYLMNDDYLIYDFGGMSNHLQGILMNKPRTLEGASSLTASFPKSRMLCPNLDEEPKLFYCGMNWEKVVSNSNRHEGLFRLLDETGKVKFFGPDKVEVWGGLKPWEGYKCYQYSIPFDGFSILNEINKCGICLVLSSDIHRRAGAATNRTYEACAAGAVIISDENEFMKYYFKDAALFIKYNKNNPKDTYEQIMEKYHWVIEHKEEALDMAKRAQRIFLENFSVDDQMLSIVNHHASRFETIRKDLFAENEDGRILVTYVINTLDVEEAKRYCKRVVKNLKRQYYDNVCLGIAVDSSIYADISDYLKKNYAYSVIVSLDLFDIKKARQYTDAQAIGMIQKNVPHDYWINILAHEVWFYDHLTTLVRTIQEEKAICAYSGRQHRDKEGYSRSDFFDNIHISTVYGMNWPDWLPVPGQMLFKSESEQYIPDFLLDCLDGYEHYAYLGVLWLRNHKKTAFSKRMTCCWNAADMDERGAVLKAEFQIRFIRDILRFYIPDGGLVFNSGTHDVVREYMLNMPLKPWIKARWYQRLLRYKIKKDNRKKKRIQKKYTEQMKRFLSY